MTTEVRWRSDRPLDFDAAMARYRRWGDDPVSHYDGAAFWRVARGAVPYRASQGPDGVVTLTSTDPDAALADLRHRLAEGLPRRPIEELAARDEVLGRLLAQAPGYRPPFIVDHFEALVTAVTAQQVNLHWATTTRTRLVHEFGRKVPFLGRELWAFPTADDLAAADPADLRALQFNWAKARTIVGVARAVADGRLAGLAEAGSGEVVARLTALWGIGPWTAEWFLARCLGRPDAVAAGDLGVRKAVGTVYLGMDRPATEAEVREVAPRWGQAANWAAHLLLEALA